MFKLPSYIYNSALVVSFIEVVTLNSVGIYCPVSVLGPLSTQIVLTDNFRCMAERGRGWAEEGPK